MTKAGNETSYFKAHSRRTAAATSAKLRDIPIVNIMLELQNLL